MNQCSSCGGFCKKSGCERANIKLSSSMTRTDLIADLRINHEYCPKDVILRAADMLDADELMRLANVDCVNHFNAIKKDYDKAQEEYAKRERDHQALSNEINDFQNTIEHQRHAMRRVIDAWDTTTHQKNGDGRLWQCMEELRMEIAK